MLFPPYDRSLQLGEWWNYLLYICTYVRPSNRTDQLTLADRRNGACLCMSCYRFVAQVFVLLLLISFCTCHIAPLVLLSPTADRTLINAEINLFVVAAVSGWRDISHFDYRIIRFHHMICQESSRAAAVYSHSHTYHILYMCCLVPALAGFAT